MMIVCNALCFHFLDLWTPRDIAVDRKIKSTSITALRSNGECSLEGCPCCDGFDGELMFPELSKSGQESKTVL